MGVELQEDESMTTRRRWPGWSRSVWHRVVWWGGWVLLVPVLVPIAVQALGGPMPQIPPLFLGTETVIEAQGVVLTSFMAGLICRSVSYLWWLKGPRPVTDSSWARWRVAISGLVSVVVLLYTVGAAAVVWLSTSSYYVLSPSSAGGCRIVLSVRGLFDATTGGVFLAVPGSPVLRRTGGEWWSDPPHDPVATSTWSLAWDGATAEVSVWRYSPDGIPISLYSPPGRPITCPQ